MKLLEMPRMVKPGVGRNISLFLPILVYMSQPSLREAVLVNGVYE